MPYVDLVSKDDWASIWYNTNTLLGNVGSFDPAQPTVMLLHPFCFDSDWLLTAFDHPRIRSAYNLVAFDARCSGHTESRPSGRHDSWVDAADLAFAHQHLGLPPVHIFAEESLAVTTALRFAVLFPSLVLSLTLCSVPPPTQLQWAFDATDEMTRTWCFAEDLESYEHATNEFVQFSFGPQIDPDLKDDIIAWLEVQYPPTRRTRFVELTNVQLNRTALSARELGSITAPVLCIQGEWCQPSPVKYAEELVKDLTGVDGGAMLYVVKGGSGYMAIVPNCCSIVAQTFAKFLSRLPPVNSVLKPPAAPLAEFMQAALGRLADFAGDATIAQRDPLSPMSFSRVSRETEAMQEKMLGLYAKNMAEAFSPLGLNGKPLRKYSERDQDHWFTAEKNGHSYAGSNAIFTGVEARRRRVESDTSTSEAAVAAPSFAPATSSKAGKGQSQAQAEIPTKEIMDVARLRRLPGYANGRAGSMSTVDKVLVTKTMKKVATSTTALFA